MTHAHEAFRKLPEARPSQICNHTACSWSTTGTPERASFAREHDFGKRPFTGLCREHSWALLLPPSPVHVVSLFFSGGCF